ncbi:MAG: polysaccharide deacetylase family protein [Limisphaerales bacterium]
MALTASVSHAGTVAAPYEIGTWRGFRPAAVSYTFDDGCSNQFAVAIPMFDARGFKLTLFSVVGATSGMFPGWPKLQKAAAGGHEIASHTLTHPNLGQLSDSQQTTELKDSQAAINANISGQKCLTLAYPYCVEANEALTGQYYIAARTCSGRIVPATPANFMDISSFVCGSQGSVRTTQDFNHQANDAVAANGWCVFLLHGIDNDGGYSPVSTATLQGSIDYMSANRDKFWVETFGNVARYILERNAASVRETSSRDDSITLQVTDNLAGSIFNYPITLRRPLPTNWPAAVVSQNHQPVSAQIVDIASKKYVMFDVVPDGGDVIISKTASRQTPAKTDAP